ncbi:hypothetical protein ACFQY7_41430 [Actinomadura luteofluorescens]|uniref:hypothetical protein n=1 Tax=Actinomadura luteofluorescens TaxID=46163 RepID=UPI0036329534
MRNNRKTIAAGAGAAGLLGLGLYFSVPAFADDPAPPPRPRRMRATANPARGTRSAGRARCAASTVRPP